MDLVASKTGYLHERKYFLDNQIVAKEEFWAIEKAWADSIEKVHKNLSLHPFLLAYSGVDTEGVHNFTHPWIKTYIKCHWQNTKTGCWPNYWERYSILCTLKTVGIYLDGFGCLQRSLKVRHSNGITSEAQSCRMVVNLKGRILIIDSAEKPQSASATLRT